MKYSNCGGLIFNRHKWYYPVELARICTKCGEMQHAFDYGFAIVSFDDWIEWVEASKILKINASKERIRGLNWLEAED